ncbi:MAG: hypothetical protein IPJ87_13040 [Flavobacteriales bacterium]|nr:hypothetical protein [Flavobacteriales bacterium]MBK8949574.1 hypothetical protein [Flavobacteriales bacterium]MBK9698823.1 hypothetical protein [Flavobacteriales bacterium]
MNRPLGSYEGARWTGKDGTFWYWESGYMSSINGTGWGAELWRYYPELEEWAWVKGPNVPNYTGHYGVQGVESPDNLPPARGFGAAAWTDTTGNLWLFGGTAYIDDWVYYADLWRFNPITENWTWMNGTQQSGQAPAYGIQGIPAPTNHPGSRNEMIATWTDHENNLWLFGGQAFNSGSVIAADLWRYSIQENKWTWMKGPSSFGSLGNYGVQGVEEPLNEPGARWAATTWTDKAGDLWLFGGRRTNNWYDNLNDLWRFRISTNSWTWMNGAPGTVSDTGAMGDLCEEDIQFSPSGRFECSAHWTDNHGDLWLWGGRTGALVQSESFLNDLWKYDVGSNSWALIGPEQPADAVGHFGAKGVPNPCNRPYGAMGNMGWYRAETNAIYLFGGQQFRPELPSSAAIRSLMWRMELDTNCVIYECPYLCDGLTVNVTVFHGSSSPTNGSATVSVEDGYSPYVAILDGEEVQQWDTLLGLAPGSHELIITDAFGCPGSASFTVTAVIDGDDDGFVVHQDGPMLAIDVLYAPMRLTLFDAIGRLVMDRLFEVGRTTVDISRIAQGIYCLRKDRERPALKLFIQ